MKFWYPNRVIFRVADRVAGSFAWQTAWHVARPIQRESAFRDMRLSTRRGEASVDSENAHW